MSALMVQGRSASHDRDGRAARARRDRRAGEARGRDDQRPRGEGVSAGAYDPGSQYEVAVIPFQEVLGERARLTLWLLMGAAAFVMIISSANVANLTLMRGVRREHELVVRAALGAGAARLRRLLLVENLVLALTGAVLGSADRDRRRSAARLARRALFAARERDSARRHGAWASRCCSRCSSRCCSSFAPTLAKEGRLASMGRRGREPHERWRPRSAPAARARRRADRRVGHAADRCGAADAHDAAALRGGHGPQDRADADDGSAVRLRGAEGRGREGAVRADAARGRGDSGRAARSASARRCRSVRPRPCSR